jgi:hypothetical protein
MNKTFSLHLQKKKKNGENHKKTKELKANHKLNAPGGVVGVKIDNDSNEFS